MNHLVDAAIVFACVFGSALLGSYLRRVLPQHHLSDESTGVVKLATGLVATMAALVLGLLISSAKSSFDTVNSEVVGNAASELADCFHFRRLRELGLERLLLGGVDEVEDGGLAGILCLSQRHDVEAERDVVLGADGDVDRREVRGSG